MKSTSSMTFRLQPLSRWSPGPTTSERGATAVEYAIMVGLIAVAVIVGAIALGKATNDGLQCARDAIEAKDPDLCPAAP